MREFIVHSYAVVRVPIKVTANTPEDAARIGQIKARVQMSEKIAYFEYADDVDSVSVVDPVRAD